MFLGLGMMTVPLTVLTYMRINAKRDLAKSIEHVTEEQDGQNGEDATPLGDRRASFRYTI